MFKKVWNDNFSHDVYLPTIQLLYYSSLKLHLCGQTKLHLLGSILWATELYQVFVSIDLM